MPDAAAAGAEVRSALLRLAEDQALERLQALEAKARDESLTAEEKAELQGLLRGRAQSGRAPAAK